MNNIHKEIARNSIIFYNNILSLPDLVYKFRNCGIKELIYWPYNKITLMVCSSDYDITKAFMNLKSKRSINFRLFRETKAIRTVPQSNLQHALDFIKSSIDYIEIDRSPQTFWNYMYKASSLSSQIKIFHKFYKISEYDIKLRNCYLSNIDNSVRELLPSAHLKMFGSTLSGLGKFNSDLDMKIILNDDVSFSSVEILRKVTSHLKKINPYMINPCVYHCKFPICHYFDDILNINVDISIKNDTSFEMCELIHLLCQTYDYFAPLCVVIKQIYIHEEILNDGPGIYFTGFKIVSLIIHYLQMQKLIPPLKELHVNNLSVVSTKEVDLGVVLTDFFRYLVDFNPEIYHIDLSEGILVHKFNNSFLSCNVHLDPLLNITRNIKKNQWNIFTRVNESIIKSLESNTILGTPLWGLGLFLDFDQSFIHQSISNKN